MSIEDATSTGNVTVTEAPVKSHTFPVVGIGASAGGINALKQFFALMPADSGMAFVVILHLSKEHESHLARILQNVTSMQVTQVSETLKVEPNTVYVIPPAKHLKMVDGVIVLVEPEQQRGRRVPIDLLFRTLGEAYHRLAICIVLSGTGSDGTLGLERIKETGGIAIVQDPDEAEYDAMPRSAIDTNLADLVLTIADMPAKLLSLKEISEKIIDPRPDDEAAPRLASGTVALREVLGLRKNHTGHDFSSYKRPTMVRRVARRMQVHDLADVSEYLEYLREDPDEIQALLRDLLISVTCFFRDTAAFEELERTVIPGIFKGKSGSDSVRVWVPACATGEEVYSLAMLLSEHAETLDDPPKIQIFASDIDAKAIALARDCVYRETIAAEVSPERLRKFFVAEGSHFRVRKSLRELVLFAQHNLLHDPPFSQLDFISCRNLLIYLNRDTQERLFEIFHFALRRDSYLFLGSSESAESLSTLFSTVDKKNRIYRSRASTSGYTVIPKMPVTGRRQGEILDGQTEKQKEATSFGELHHRLVEYYAPPSVLVTEDFVIVHLSESVGHLLRFAGGEPSRNLLKVVHPDLRGDLRAALMEAKQEKRATETRNVMVDVNGVNTGITIRVRPFEGPETAGAFFLVVFDESAPSSIAAEVANTREAAGESYVRRLEEELEEAWDRLRTTSVRNETSDEELRAANEELQAIIEELRSASEELETSKEELQSVNEELTTVNQELKEKIDEVSRSNSDVHNLMASTDIATIFLDTELKIKRYTKNSVELFNILPADIGRPLAHLTHRLQYDNLVENAADVVRTFKPFEREVRAENDRVYIARFLPYKTLDDRIEGVVLTFIDITVRKTAEESRRWLSSIVSSSNDAIISFTLDHRIVSWNAAAERLFGYSAKEVLGRLISNAIGPDGSHDQEDLFSFMTQGDTIANFETIRRTKDGRTLEVSLSVSPITDDDGVMIGVTAIVQDISERKLAQQMLRDADRRKDEFLAMLAHELRNPLAPILSGLEVIRGTEDDPEMIESMVGVIQRQTLQLMHLVNDLLDVSRITQGKIQLRMEHVELSTVVSMAVETSQESIEDAGLTLALALPAEPIFIDADRTRIAQVLVNILNNAAKYSEPGGEIVLAVEKRDEAVEIRIRDMGIGIPQAELSGIFDMFNQIDIPDGRVRSGLGIGLSVVRRLVEMHQGTVTAFSEGEGKGSEFLITLPLADRQNPLPGLSAIQMPSQVSVLQARRLRLLVVDDNADAAELLGILLRRDNHIVHIASDGAAAIKALVEFRPDVCLLDIGLPDINGYEVARRIREQSPGMTLIAITGWGQEEDRARSARAGFNHHLVKPVDIESLRRVLE